MNNGKNTLLTLEMLASQTHHGGSFSFINFKLINTAAGTPGNITRSLAVQGSQMLLDFNLPLGVLFFFSVVAEEQKESLIVCTP